MGALAIREDMSAAELRRLARREKDGRAAARMYAIANALEGMSRAEAARLAGMERQALRDAVVRYNAVGLAGLHDRPKGRPSRRLTADEEAELRMAILEGPDMAVDGVCAWTLPALCRLIERRWNKQMHPANLSKVVRKRLGLSHQKARPFHPKADPEAQEAFKKGGSPTPWTRCASRIPASG